ncbi:nudix hydrolase [Escherichia phage RB16]|uniref:NudE nudix hydrolase n=1 Tax=Escherichia phage RB16 TaxID=2681599 RepID=D9ICN3_BPRB1|nr:nudix hydrolase [Escherichia phage RB16]ADJ55476.1 NudE nudix hydrolase [Escherichia phage RB16]
MERSAGILFLNNGSVLMGHATETPHWDIPKGHIEKGESPINAAIRECFEETGVVVEQHELLSLGLIDYTSKKELVLFVYVGNNYPEAEKCVCASTFVKNGRTITEMDDFKYVPYSQIRDHARKTMGHLLTKLVGSIS